MRFRKSIKLFPGVRINLSGSGISTSVGVKGATVNIKPGRKTRATVGIPGTGLSESVNLENDAERTPRTGPSLTFVVIVILLVLFGVYGVMH